jgi:hypothetical protein
MCDFKGLVFYSSKHEEKSDLCLCLQCSVHKAVAALLTLVIYAEAADTINWQYYLGILLIYAQGADATSRNIC